MASVLALRRADRTALPCGNTSPTSPTRRSSRSWHASERSSRSPSCTTGAPPRRVRARAARAPRRGGSPRTPCRRRSSRSGARPGRFIPERAKASTWILTLVHRRAVDLVRREQRRLHGAADGGPMTHTRWGLCSRRDGVAAPRARARAGRAGRSCPTPNARHWSSPTTAASRGSRAGRATRPTAGHHQESYVRRTHAPA